MTSEKSLDLVFLPANSCCFIPVNFSAMDGAIGESDLRDTFPLAPTPSAKEFLKPGNLADSRPNRKCFNLRDRAEQLKIHEVMVPKLCGIRQWERLNGEESAGPHALGNGALHPSILSTQTCSASGGLRSSALRAATCSASTGGRVSKEVHSRDETPATRRVVAQRSSARS